MPLKCLMPHLEVKFCHPTSIKEGAISLLKRLSNSECATSGPLLCRGWELPRMWPMAEWAL
eukprot:scaffold3777_cov123-Isochrysis_galbana.AAC.14